MFIRVPAAGPDRVDHTAIAMSIPKSQGKRFSELQGQYLAFIDAYTKVNGRAPAERDLERYFAVTPPSVHQMVLTLERKGLIQRTPGEARSIEVLVRPEELPRLR